MDKQIQRFLQKYSKQKNNFNTNVQRAELILRNKSFLKELEQIKEDLGIEEFLEVWKILDSRNKKTALVEKKITKEDVRTLGEKKIPQILGKNSRKSLKLFKAFQLRWKSFCEKWNIRPNWDGNLKSLKSYLKVPIELYWVKDTGQKDSALLLRINNWTTQEDIKRIWPRIEEYQNRLWKKEEKKARFRENSLQIPC